MRSVENLELNHKAATVEQSAARANEKALSLIAQSQEFVQHRGALFKRKPGGGFHQAVYCPRCKLPADSVHRLPFSCYCGWRAGFESADLWLILQELAEA